MSNPIRAAVALGFLVLFSAAGVSQAPQKADGSQKANDSRKAEGPRLIGAVEFFLLEDAEISGVTAKVGFRTTCGPELSYPHLKPILTAGDVAQAHVRHSKFPSTMGDLDSYSITFLLSEPGVKKLTQALGKSPKIEVASMINGQYKGTRYIRAADTKKVEMFAGFFNSKDDVDEIVKSFKK